jgi:DNA-directed RNA polymerase subunit B
MKYQLEKVIIRRHGEILVSNSVRPGIITERLQHAIATGNWIRGRVGVTQLLDRTNYYSTLSHLRRLQSPLSRSQPNLEARDLHPTHWGRLCPNETPEGANCGLVKNLALTSEISVGSPHEPLMGTLKDEQVIPLEEASDSLRDKGIKVIMDGIIVGYSKDPEKFVTNIREMRRRGAINYQINIVSYPAQHFEGRDEIYINCDEGRVRRPLIIVENGVPLITEENVEKIEKKELVWSTLIKNGVVEYLDADEEENTLVALNVSQINSETTHLEVSPYAILGVCASLIPYPEHNQSPRNAYESAMAKQALGVYSCNFFNRLDSRGHLLNYPQAPIVTTKSMKTAQYNERPAGQNLVLAVLTSQSYNMEDAIIMNKSSVDRGLCRSTFFRSYEGECRQYLGGLKDKFELPEQNIRGYRGEQYYRLLEEDGVIPVETDIEGNTVLIGRTSPPRFLEEYREFEVSGPARRDSSICMRPSEMGIVDDVFVTESIEGNKLVKVRVRDTRIPELGDKFASRHGQKGVIGLLVPSEDMPFTEDGVIPDIIMNPHAFPSRMTMGQFIESISGKLAASEGTSIDGTPFNEENKDNRALQRRFLDAGFQYNGREVCYNGISGEKLEVDVFMGVVYYQKLHHMVADKMHARARGQVQMLTRQPTEGRARGGGLRFGEMERDCLIGHGTSALLMDRLLEESDKATILVCEECGLIAYYDIKQNRYTCRICAEKSKISPVTLSYAFKLLLQELMTLGIAPRIELKERA